MENFEIGFEKPAIKLERSEISLKNLEDSYLGLQDLYMIIYFFNVLRRKNYCRGLSQSLEVGSDMVGVVQLERRKWELRQI